MDGDRGITALSVEVEEEIFLCGVTFSSRLASCSSKVSSCCSGALDTEAEGDHLMDCR